MSTGSIEVSFLEDGAQPAERTAGELSTFIEAAHSTLEIAIYDLNLGGEPAEMLRNAIHGAVQRRVSVRLIYNLDFPNPIPVPPPSQPDTAFIESLEVPARAVPGIPALMHHKYVVRDSGSPNAAVWTGSTNWTNDSWTREENVIVRLPSPALAADYRQNFEELWASGRVDVSGRHDLPPVKLWYQGGRVKTHVLFSPGRGHRMAHVVAERLGQARGRIRVCSPVITDGPILGTLAEVAGRGLDIRGVYDRTQMTEVLGQWRDDPHASWKAPVFTSITARVPFASKVTTPYAPGSVHDFMHAKITIVDDTVLTGSYNLSHSGEENAENLVEFNSAGLADVFAAFVDRVYARYAASSSPIPSATMSG